MTHASQWDVHAHVIGDRQRFPFVAPREYTPPPAPLEAYLAMLDRHGIDRGVLVQPSVYGYDNACLLDALDRADGRLAGVVVPPPDATARDLEAMHRRGARGVRVNLINPGALAIDRVLGWQPALAALGWHVELHVAIANTRAAELVARFDVPVVIDHMGRPDPGRVDPRLPHLAELIALVRDRRCFVKLSAPYRLSASAPPWPDVTPLARALLAADPRRCLWATDWPHVHTAPAVETSDLFTALDAWCDTPATRQILLSAAARELY